MRRIFQYHARASLRQSSYAAGFFRFKVDPTELFPYPSHKLDTEEWDNIQSLIEQIRSNDKDLNTTGSRIAPEYGGLGLSHTAHALLCEELGTSGGSSALTAIQHASLAHFLLSTVGTKELKGKYLTAMSDGTIFMGWAVRENCGSDLSMNKTEAVLEGGKYVLSGTKVAFFAKSSTHFLVLAKANTQAATEGGPAEVKRSSFFVVPKGETGVSIDETSNTVTFHKSPAVDVIGAIGEGFHDVSIATLTEQYAYAAALLGTLKRVVQELRDAVPDKWAVNTIASCACSMYAMESALYALTANLDLPTEDILFEASLVTAFIQSATNEWLSTLSTATPTSKVLEGCFANARSLLSMMEPTDYLYAVPTCCGIEDCGVAFQGSSTLQMMQSRFARTIGMKERIPLKQIDCSLIDSAIVNFSNAVETTFVRNTTQAQYQQLILNRLGEAASLLYVASATASRAAMCATKRLATAKTEKELASAFILTAVSRANFLSTECQNTGLTADDSYMRIALELCEDALK